jgi:3-phosphoshikimate 1-carboxyvinyltransferase
MQALGLKIDALADRKNALLVQSPGLEQLHAPNVVLDAGNSGTTMRIMSGLVAGRPFASRFDGDASLRRRPMSRVLDLLQQMGAEITYESENGNAKKGCAPFMVTGTKLTGRHFDLAIASAQVQTALLLAGLQADGTTSVSLPQVARDHTLRMFKHMDVPFEQPTANTISVRRLEIKEKNVSLEVPADISSAAFFMVAAACLPGSEIVLLNCGINQGRTLIVDILKRMGADVEIIKSREACCEPIADIQVRYNGQLHGATVSGDEIAAGIDEIPILALAGALCDGELRVEGAEELRHKESDRLEAIATNLRSIGGEVEDRSDGLIVKGRKILPGKGLWQTHEDHRMAMTGLIASVLCENEVEMTETDSIKISYPNFKEDLKTLLAQ